MKPLLFILILLPLMSFSQYVKVFPYEAGEVVIKGADSVPGATVQDLEARAKYFLTMQADKFNSDQNIFNLRLDQPVIYSDSTNAQGKVRFVAKMELGFVFEANVKIEFRAGKYRYQFTNFRTIYNGLAGYTNDNIKMMDKKAAKKACEKTLEIIRSIEADLNTTMQKGVQKDPW